MKICGNLHTHTLFSDGQNSLEEMVQKAIEKDFAYLGFSEHAYAAYDIDCCIHKEDIPVYLDTIAALKKKYAGRIEIYTGFESDAYSLYPKDGLDFTIGSVHALRDEAGNYYAVDNTPQILEQGILKVAGGDVKLFVKRYFELLLDMAENYRPDIVGHMDLCVKLNSGKRYFDEDAGWYKQLCEDAVQRIVKTGCIVEVNTGGMQRGYRTEPYPSRYILKLLYGLGAPVTLSSDAHSAQGLDYAFDYVMGILKQIGYPTVKCMVAGKWQDVEL